MGSWAITLVEIDADKIDDIARKFFQLNYTMVDIVNKTFREDVWFVKVLVSSFGKQSSRMLSIESKTGRIISCE